MKAKPNIDAFRQPAKDPTEFLESGVADRTEARPALSPAAAPVVTSDVLVTKPEPTVQKLFRLRWDVANALKLKAAESVHTGVQRVTERAASTAKTISDVATGSGSAGAKVSKAAAGVGSMVDPMHLWGSLTQQFQQIAAGAFKEASTKTAVDMTKNMATGMAKGAMKSAKAAGKKAASGAVKRVTKPAARKTAPRSR